MKIISKTILTLILIGSFQSMATSESQSVSSQRWIETSAWGPTEAWATRLAIEYWQRAARSSRMPGITCKYWAVGPGWECFAIGSP